MTKPIREFSANEGDYSIGLAGPDAIEQDIDTIMRMFDPLTTHEDGSAGGIGTDNIKAGAIGDSLVGDRTIDPAIADAYSNTGTLTKLFSWLAKTIKALKGTTNWYDTPADTINNIHSRVSTNAINIGVGVTALNTHKTSVDHDGRYYTEAELNAGQLDSRYYTETELNEGKLNTLYYTKSQLEGFLGGGDTNILEEVFVIVNQDNLDGTFTYNDGTQDIIGTISPEGYLVFVLQEGDYVLGENRIECIIDDSSRKSVASGGLVEISETEIATTSTYEPGTEITFRYYQRIAVAAEYNIKLNTLEPPLNSGRNMWFEETSEIADVKNVTIRPEIDNDYLKEIHPKTNAGQVTETSTKKIMTSEERDKLNGIQAGAQVNTVNSVAGRTGVVVLNKADVGLGNVDNYAVASYAEAEAMTSDDKYMTPVKTKVAALKAVGELFPVTSSYMEFCSEGYGSTANPDALDAALGKNNEDMILQIGRQLAMYAWFKGTNRVSYPFTNLKELSSLADIIASSLGREEAMADGHIANIINYSPYSRETIKNCNPVVNLNSLAVIKSSNVLSTTISLSSTEQTFGSLTVPYSGVYEVQCRFRGDYSTHKLYKNGVIVGTKTADIVSTGEDDRAKCVYFSPIQLTAGDTVSVTVTGNSGKYVKERCLALIADRDITWPTAIVAGDVPVWLGNETTRTTTDTIQQNGCSVFTAPKNGTYRVKISNCYVAYLYKNGGLIETISSAGLTSRDVALVTGDTLTVYSKGFNSSTDANDHFAGVPIFAICLSANLNTYPVS